MCADVVICILSRSITQKFYRSQALGKKRLEIVLCSESALENPQNTASLRLKSRLAEKGVFNAALMGVAFGKHNKGPAFFYKILIFCEYFQTKTKIQKSKKDILCADVILCILSLSMTQKFCRSKSLREKNDL